jgi:hypothetical protein
LPYLIGVPVCGYINESSGSAKGGMFFALASVLTGATVLFLMECFKGHAHPHAHLLRHHELCKMDTAASDTMDSHNADHLPRQPRRPSDFGSVSDVQPGAGFNNVSGANIANGLMAELAHLVSIL